MSQKLQTKIDLTREDQIQEGAKESKQASDSAKKKSSQNLQESTIANQIAQVEKRITEKFRVSQIDIDKRML
jgi:hypothetical protein